ncbi:hypothetical protein OIN60_20060 [Paenibacillus sp. P96]|uniref:Uncharacterized protein n=1 Tax=Paenibacillus zeirhizosphaerae TaxID=2987519 RepID=A0ABT9FWM1_9BACL|nr:hypothetical protein [Paenibacillus sp. P96]MDP4099024.1 hypothetical protein [Paenibacillus sp. P96]
MNKFMYICGTASMAALLMSSGPLTAAQASEVHPPHEARKEKSAPEQRIDQGHTGPRWSFLNEVAKVLGMTSQELSTEIDKGSTLAEIAKKRSGWSEEQLTAKLVPMLNARVDELVKQGHLTAEEAKARKALGAAWVKQMVNKPLRELHGFHRSRPRGWGVGIDRAAVARILGLTPTQLETELRKGKSVAEIAQKRGMGEDELIRKLKDEMTGDLKQMINRKAPISFERTPSNARATAGE